MDRIEDVVSISEAARLSHFSVKWLQTARCPLQPVHRLSNGARLYDRAEAERIGAERAKQREARK